MTRLKTLVLVGVISLAPGLLLGCASQTSEGDGAEDTTAADVSGAADPSEGAADAGEMAGAGTLLVRANGEDFVRQGFTTKDGWQISFDHVYVNLADVKAYQTDPPYDPSMGEELKAQETIDVAAAQTVDLAEGDENAEPVLVAELPNVPAGRYNAISWQMSPATEGPAAGYTLVMDGTAQKDGQTVDFVISSAQELAYTCGEYVGDQRKGILSDGEQADLEATFHFDHIFGDGEAPSEDPINTGALGFEPLAALAENGQLETDVEQLQSSLSAEEYATLEEAMQGLAHVGEGHCEQATLSAT